MTDTGKVSRAEVAPPKRATKQSFLGTQVKAVGAADNMAEEKKFMLSFSVPLSWHKRFKMTAADSNMKMVELLMESFELWEKENKK